MWYLKQIVLIPRTNLYLKSFKTIFMKQEIDINTWGRKNHFEFYSKFDEPFFGVTVSVDCTSLYEFSKKHQLSFFLLYLHKSLKAANTIEAFRYRILDGKVFLFDTVNASPTINRPDGTFGFSYMLYYENFEEFSSKAQIEMQRVKNTSELMPATSGENVIHYSSLPWINFTSLSHARHFAFDDSCPKITFGKMIENENRKSMPTSIHAHHALVDGYHVGQFIETFQNELNKVDSII